MNQLHLLKPPPRQTIAQQLAVPCPRCGAGRGEFCVTTTDGSPAAATHRARKRAAAYRPVG